MKVFRLLVLLAFSAAAWAQSPSDGAIKGGSILPGEKSGMPEKEPARKAEQETLEKRCEELSGSLREDCLKQQREQGASDTRRKLPEPADSAAGSSSSPR
jgi:hypothetical protein